MIDDNEVRIMQAAGCTLVAIDKVKIGWGWYEYIGGAYYNPDYWHGQRRGYIEDVYCHDGQWYLYVTRPEHEIWTNGTRVWMEDITHGQRWTINTMHIWVRIPKRHWQNAREVSHTRLGS